MHGWLRDSVVGCRVLWVFAQDTVEPYCRSVLSLFILLNKGEHKCSLLDHLVDFYAAGEIAGVTISGAQGMILALGKTTFLIIPPFQVSLYFIIFLRSLHNDFTSL